MDKRTKEQEDIRWQNGLEEGVSQGVFPGASLGVLEGEARCFYSGKTRADEKGLPIQNFTLYDLASLTKPLATALLSLHCFDRGLFYPDDSISRFFPVYGSNQNKAIRIQDLLSHSSGLPAYQPYFKEFDPVGKQLNSALLVERIIGETLVHQPGEQCLYSDLGYILLGSILEQILEDSLDRLFTRLISEPLGLADQLFFIPEKREDAITPQFAATENCPWRGRVLQGEVHDEHCYLMGGVAGHAGLFGSLTGVIKLCGDLLAIWQGKKRGSICSRSILRRALQPIKPGESWTLGFDTPSPGASSSGRYFSPNSVGHLGYTGTSFWIDLERKVIIVLLSNRVHPSRENSKIREYRPYIHDLVMGDILGKENRKAG